MVSAQVDSSVLVEAIPVAALQLDVPLTLEGQSVVHPSPPTPFLFVSLPLLSLFFFFLKCGFFPFAKYVRLSE